MSHRSSAHRRSLLLRSGLLSLTGASLLLAPHAARSEELYKLETKCALRGATPVACTVSAVEEAGATVYTHRIGKVTEIVRITDQPVRMSIWRSSDQKWEPIRGAAARFSTNTICFNNRELCVVNPNYLNSVREDRASTNLAGRDLVMVHFGSDGRVDASCYDDACALIQK